LSDEFDTEALRQAAETPWPTDFREQTRLWVQNASDLAAAADYIEELEKKIALTAAVRGVERRDK
jgi:hypothetical protein